MENKNIISIKKTILISLVVSFTISFLIVFGLNHLGQFQYIADTSNIPSQDEQGKPYLSILVPSTNEVLSVSYVSYFDSIITINRPGYTVSDVRFSNTGKFYTYDNVVKYYVNGTIKDLKYVVGICIFMFTLYLFFTKNKINLT